MYLFALGPLRLKREELWTITNGELADMMEAHRYRLYEDRRERAIMTAALMNIHLKRPVSAQDLVGIWRKGSILTKDEFVERWKKERRRGKDGDNGENAASIRHRSQHQ